jgi:hypothetical protein
MTKRKYIEDAALVIDGRVKALEAEMARDRARGNMTLASDVAAVQEAKHLARLIRSLKIGNYRDPYAAASDHWIHGRAADNLNLD